jgi:hypothetical protein
MSSPNAAAIASPRGLHPCLAAARRSLSLTGMCVPSRTCVCPLRAHTDPHYLQPVPATHSANPTVYSPEEHNVHASHLPVLILTLSRALSRSLLGRERESPSGVAERRRQYPMPSAEAARALRLPCLGLESVFPFMLAWVYLGWRHRHRCCRCSGAARRAVPLSGPLPPHSLARAAAPASPPRLFRSLRPSLLPNAQLPLTFCV